jgi:hypothetical protein
MSEYRLSQDYSYIKCKYEELKETCRLQGSKNREMAQKLIAAEAEIKRLQEYRPEIVDESVLRLLKSSVKGEYVTRKKYDKQRRLAEDYANRYGVENRMNIQLREKIREYEREKSSSVF